MNAALKILVVEDNEELLAATLAFFQRQGHDARGVALAEEICDVAGGFIPDVYVIDVNLPDEDGLSLTRRLRTSHPHVGIVIATARTLIGDKVKGYESGADVYLTKPVHPQELMASVAAMGKRSRNFALQHHDTVTCHLVRMQLVGHKGVVQLSAGDTQILSALLRAPGRHLQRWQLAAIIGLGKDDAPSAGTLEMRMARLRKKLVSAGAPSPCIKAARNSGYTLCCPVTVQ